MEDLTADLWTTALASQEETEAQAQEEDTTSQDIDTIDTKSDSVVELWTRDFTFTSVMENKKHAELICYVF